MIEIIARNPFTGDEEIIYTMPTHIWHLFRSKFPDEKALTQNKEGAKAK